jgi:anti-anti-sigma regulatory factor
MNSWISGAACGEFPPVCFPGTGRVLGADGATAGGWRPRFLLPGPAGSLQASLTQRPRVLHLAGDIDEWTYPYLLEVLARMSEAGERWLQVDLTDVRYCDVAGLRAIVSLPGGSRDGRSTIEQIVLAHLPVPLNRLLRVLGWDAAPGVILEGCAR